MRTDHLRALEEGNFEVFSAPVYIRGFVRTYATLLKLDVPQVMAALEAELGASRKFSEPPPLAQHPRGMVDLLMLQLSRVEGIIPALESAHAVAEASRRAPAASGKIFLINLSGRGDKDIDIYRENFPEIDQP